MEEEDLAKMDFSRDLDIVKECSEKLKASGINHWLIFEATDVGGLYSRYDTQNWVGLPDKFNLGEQAFGASSEMVRNHLGGLIACVFDHVNYQFQFGAGRQATMEELVKMMFGFRDIYLNNVQPE